jgi:hypothetical protein
MGRKRGRHKAMSQLIKILRERYPPFSGELKTQTDANVTQTLTLGRKRDANLNIEFTSHHCGLPSDPGASASLSGGRAVAGSAAIVTVCPSVSPLRRLRTGEFRRERCERPTLPHSSLPSLFTPLPDVQASDFGMNCAAV